MRLLMFEHCSLCFRVRMTAALNGIALDEQVVLDDDDGAMVSLIGRRQIPILVKDDGTPMLESMDMVRYIDGLGSGALGGAQRPEIAAWASRFVALTPPLTMPRYPLLGLPEHATATAREHFVARKRAAMGDLDRMLADTHVHLCAVTPELGALDAMIVSPHAVSGAPSLDDVLVLPLLRSVAVVADLRMPSRVRAYFETSMARLGARPLPSI